MHLFNQNKTKLNIEIISPGSLSGWVFHEKFQFIKIFLEVNKKVLAESEINIPRKDVNQNFNLKEKQVVGFILNLPLELDYEAEEISIFAKTELRTKRYYFLEKKNIKDYSFLKKILNSNYLGRKGNIDGFQNDGQITGWVYHEKKRVENIWICSKDNQISKSIKINRNRYLQDFEISGDFGFTLNPKNLGEFFSKKEVYFSFDQAGIYRIPQKNKLFIPEINPNEKAQSFALENISPIEPKWKSFINSKEGNKKDIWVKFLIVECILDIEEAGLDLLPKLPFKFLREIKNINLDDVHIQSKFEELSEKLFFKIWNNRNKFINIYGVFETRNFLKESLSIITPNFVNTKTIKSIKNIAIIDTGDLVQCTLYRVKQKISQIENKKLNTTVFKLNQIDLFLKTIHNFDAVIFFRLPAFPEVIKAITNSNKFGLETFYDIDDLIFEEKLFPPPYESYSELIEKEQFEQLTLDTCLYDHAMKLCLYGISSTKCLSKYMQKRVLTGKVFHHKNALSPIHYDLIEKQKQNINPIIDNKKIQIFYGTGTLAHKDSFHTILEPALARIIEKYGDKIKINLFGTYGEFLFLNQDSENCEVKNAIWDYKNYLQELSKNDINLAILEDSEITNCKSEIKWLEASIFKIPSVLTPTKTYKEVIKDGDDGLFAINEDDFFLKLESLILDQKLRQKIGLNAFNKSMNLYSLNNLSENIYDLLHENLKNINKLKKKILIVNVYYPPQDWGGATHVVRDNVNELCKNYRDDFDIEILTTEFGGMKDLELKYDSDIFNNIRVWRITVPPQEMGDLTVYDERNLENFDKIINITKPDIVHLHCIQRITTSIIDVILKKNIPYIITAHDGWWISPNQFIVNDLGVEEYYNYNDYQDQSYRCKTLKPYLQNAACITTVSESFKKIHHDCGIQNIVNIENGMVKNTHEVKKIIHNEKVMLTHIGGSEFHKGLSIVKNVLEKSNFKNLEFSYIDYSQSEGLINKEKWGSTKVYKYGRFNQGKVFDFLADKNILIVPSRWPESYGLVVREGLLSGCRVITSNKGALFQDIKEGENGFIFDLENAEESLFNILDFIDNNHKTFLKPLEKPYIARSVKKQVEEFVEIYKKILFKN